MLLAGVAQIHEVETGEERLARAQEDGGDGDVEFIDQAFAKVLPDGGRSAADADILSVGGSASPFQRGVNPVANEMKGRASLHDEGRAGMMREHENLGMVNRVLAPPAPPDFVRPGAAHRPEHIPSHYSGADIVKAARGKVVVDASFSVGFTEQLRLKGARRERPAMQGGSANTQRLLQALIQTGAKAIDRNGEAFHAEFSHLVILSVVALGRACLKTVELGLQRSGALSQRLDSCMFTLYFDLFVLGNRRMSNLVHYRRKEIGEGGGGFWLVARILATQCVLPQHGDPVVRSLALRCETS